LPIGFRWIAKVPELLLVAAIGWCFGLVFLGAGLDRLTDRLLGFDFHMAVGPGMSALIAGASIASLPYSTDVVGKVAIVKDFFVTLFFVALGMSIPLPDGVQLLMLALGLSALAVAARYLVFFPLFYWAGLDRRNAVISATRLAQVSEFGLVIAYAGFSLGHITAELNSVIIFAFVLTALITPFMFQQADNVHERLGPWLGRLGFREPPSADAGEEASYGIALLGFHRLASSVFHELALRCPDLTRRTLVVDYNVALHGKIKDRGATVCYGDLRNPETLHHCGVDKAKVVVITVPDDLLKGTRNRHIVQAVRHMAPDASIIANAIEFREVAKLYAAGADYVYLPRIDGAQALLPAILSALEGRLSGYREDREAREGRWEERDEVLN
jgi:voltage-gated potassium channel Kch